MSIDWTQMKTAKQKADEKALDDAKARIANLKAMLRDTDYVSLPDYDKDKPDVLAQRAEWRAEIRELEEQYNLEA